MKKNVRTLYTNIHIIASDKQANVFAKSIQRPSLTHAFML